MADSIVELIKHGAKIVDVRTPAEFQDGAYPNAINIPVQVLPTRLAELPKNEPIILYCASGARSAAATQTLKRAGYTQVMNAGGLFDMPEV